jgi:hypothetical protein
MIFRPPGDSLKSSLYCWHTETKYFRSTKLADDLADIAMRFVGMAAGDLNLPVPRPLARRWAGYRDKSEALAISRAA